MSLILKWVLIAAIVGWGIWSWRRMQGKGDGGVSKPPGDRHVPRGPEATLACSHCGVHAARAEMLRGQHGVYCCIQHCQAHGDQAAQ